MAPSNRAKDELPLENLEDETGAPEASEDAVPNDNTKATIDMILTIVGELYGQRDLLQFRDDVEWI
jgi:hypothetical protein